MRLLHNDLKPGSLFLNAEEECLVGDFGCATLIPPGAPGVLPRGATPETAGQATGHRENGYNIRAGVEGTMRQATHVTGTALAQSREAWLRDRLVTISPLEAKIPRA